MIASKDADAYIEYQIGYDVWAASAFRRLGFSIIDNKMLVMSTKAIGLYEIDGGQEIWKVKWDYDQKDFDYPPQIINNKIVFCLDSELKAIDINSGKITWENDEAKNQIFQPTPTGKYLIVLDEKNVTVYDI